MTSEATRQEQGDIKEVLAEIVLPPPEPPFGASTMPPSSSDAPGGDVSGGAPVPYQLVGPIVENHSLKEGPSVENQKPFQLDGPIVENHKVNQMDGPSVENQKLFQLVGPIVENHKVSLMDGPSVENQKPFQMVCTNVENHKPIQKLSSQDKLPQALDIDFTTFLADLEMSPFQMTVDSADMDVLAGLSEVPIIPPGKRDQKQMALVVAKSSTKKVGKHMVITKNKQVEQDKKKQVEQHKKKNNKKQVEQDKKNQVEQPQKEKEEKEKKKEEALERNRIRSKFYHQERVKCLAKGMSPDKAKLLARIAGQKAVDAVFG